MDVPRNPDSTRSALSPTALQRHAQTHDEQVAEALKSVPVGAIMSPMGSTPALHVPADRTAHRRTWRSGEGGQSESERAETTMTPTEVATHAARSHGLLVAPRPGNRWAGRIYARLINEQQWSRTRLLTDVLVLYLASSLALFADPPVRTMTTDRWLAAIFPLAAVLMLRARRSPDDRLNVSVLDTLTYVLGVVSLTAMLTISVASILGVADPLALALRLWIFSVVYLGIARAMLVLVRSQAMRTEALAVPTLIVGAGVIGMHLVKRLLGEPSYGLRPVGFLDANPLPSADPPTGLALPVLGGTDDLPSAIARTGARRVILAFSGEPDHVLVATVRQCEALGVDVSLVPRLYEAINERTTLDHVGGLPLLTLHSINPRGWQFAVKHAVDRTVALLALLVASPVMLVVAIAVRLSSPGPIWFRQRRVGRDGHEFDVLKFRTMRTVPDPQPSGIEPVEGNGFELPDGVAPGGVEGIDRRTGLGRFLRDMSLDELPQLVNVLRGDMSLVGPRPERPQYVARFVRDVARYEDRHRVKSGITGWAQVNGLRGQTSIADRVEWDNYYIQNWSLRLDLRIMLLTIAEMFRSRDSANSRPGHDTAADAPASGRRHEL
jgi:exopolysaccharide biosynthesis polyprenyl glycosylphosphotransferase